MEPSMAILALIVIALSIWLTLMIPAQMAVSRDRSAILWALVSLLCSPLIGILLLWALGPKNDPEEEEPTEA